MSQLIQKELELENVSDVKEHFWTDSQVVLGYINSESKIFKVSLANRMQLIHNNSNTNQWYYVDTKSNPADDASRGLVANSKKVHRVFNGPDFMWQSKNSWGLEKDCWPGLNGSVPEVKHEVIDEFHENLLKLCTYLVRGKDIRLDKNE